MIRRDLIKSSGVAAAASCLPLLAQAQPARNYQEGQDYIALDKRVPTEGKGVVEVIEFFWYNCPHCNAFEPMLEKWASQLPKDIVLRRMPVAFRDEFVPQQRLFYALEAMNKLDDLHKKVFYAIHVEKKRLDAQAAISEWVAANGVDKAKFDELYNSFSVQTKARRAAQLQNDYRVGGVPALGIAGRFYTDGALAQSMGRALQITDWLIGEVKKGR
ncbi:MAG: thiol:disulfide interchange protein DsbA/DsbL [Brachymonas sp.]